MDIADRNEKLKIFLKPWAVLAIILVLAAALRLMGLGTRGVWLDEAYEIGIVNGAAVKDIITGLRNDVSPPLHYIILAQVTKLFGPHELHLRLPSVLFGLLLIAAVYGMMRRMFPETQSAFISALFITLSPVDIFYSQEIRPYSMLALLGVVSFFSLTRGLATGRLFWWITCSISLILTFFTHYSSGILFLSFIAVAVFTAPDRARLMQFVIAGIPLAAVFILWYPEFQIHSHNAGFHTSSAVWSSLGARVALLSFNTFMGAYDIPSYLLRVPSSPLEALAYAVYVPSIVLAVRDCFSGRVEKEQRTFLISLLIYGALSYAIILMAAMTGRAALLPGRTDFIIYPAVVMLAGYGLSRFNQPWRSIALCTAILISCLSLNRYYSDTSRFNDRTVALNHIPSIAKPHDAILLTTAIAESYKYYLSESGSRLAILEYPSSFLSRCNTNTDMSESDLQKEADMTAGRIDDYFRKAPPGSGLIVVLQLEDPHVKYLYEKLGKSFSMDPDTQLITVESSTTFHPYIVGRIVPVSRQP